MRKTIFVVGIVCAVVLLIGGLAAQFRNDGRKYCRVRFGTSDPHEVILARTSSSILVFRTGYLGATPESYPFEDGRLPEEIAIPPIRTESGKSYTINSISEHIDEEPDRRHALMLNVSIEGDAAFTQYCDVELVNGTDKWKLAHFDGPLSIGPVTVNWEIPAGKKFVIGGDPTDLRANVGTLDKSRGCWTVVQVGNDKFPVGVCPTVTVEFPTEQAASPIIRTYPLDEFC